jgi:hypothetical protein
MTQSSVLPVCYLYQEIITWCEEDMGGCDGWYPWGQQCQLSLSLIASRHALVPCCGVSGVQQNLPWGDVVTWHYSAVLWRGQPDSFCVRGFEVCYVYGVMCVRLDYTHTCMVLCVSDLITLILAWCCVCQTWLHSYMQKINCWLFILNNLCDDFLLRTRVSSEFFFGDLSVVHEWNDSFSKKTGTLFIGRESWDWIAFVERLNSFLFFSSSKGMLISLSVSLLCEV